MSTSWVRLWQDMPTDPKWRVVAKRSGRSLPEVIAVFMFMMTNAGANATERGELDNWSHDDIAAALDMEAEHVAAIYEAMQGKTLEGKRLTGWEKRQPKREDSSAERAKAWRERKRTQSNGEKRPDSDSEADAEVSTPKAPKGADDDFQSNVKPVADWSKAFATQDQSGVSIQGDRIVLVNGTQARWLEAFDGDAAALDLALIEARGSVQPNSRSHSLSAQVERQLARIVAKRRDQDRRYAAAVAKNVKAKIEQPMQRTLADALRDRVAKGALQ